MSAIQQAMVAGNGAINVGEVTAGTASGFRGYLTAASGVGSAGSWTGSVSVKNATIQRICSLSGTVDFQIELDGIRSQSHFTGVRVWDTNDVLRTYYTNDVASFSAASDTQWNWGTGSSVVWDANEVHRVEFF